MLGKKGLAFTTIAIIGLIAATGAGIAGYATIGEIQTLLEFIVTNWWTLFLSVLGVAVAGIAVANSVTEGSNWKNWREDLMGLGALVGILVFLGFLPTVMGAVSSYTATIEFGVNTPWGLEGNLCDVQVTNIEETSAGDIFRPGDMSSFWFHSDDVYVEMDATCDGERVEKTFSITTNSVGQAYRETTLKGLEKGFCEVRFELYDADTDEKWDTEKISFNVG